MSSWGSLLGGVIGFSLGGPFGALLGSFLGGKISNISSSNTFGNQQNSQQIFALSLIILSAKLSKADGRVSKEELIAVKEKLQIPDSEIDQVAKIFNKAKDEILLADKFDYIVENNILETSYSKVLELVNSFINE